MANTLQIKRKATAGVPSGLAAGELAVNLSDSKLYVGNAAANGVLQLNNHLPLAGGTLSGTLTIGGTIASTSDFIIDSADGIVLDAGGDTISLKDDGVRFGILQNSSNNFVIQNPIDDKDILFKIKDGGTVKTALTLDGSENGNATFSGAITATGGTLTGNLTVETSSHTGIEVKGGTSHDNYILFSDTSANAKIGWDHSSTALKFNASATFNENHLVVKSTGVGIGSSAPAKDLEIYTASHNPTLRINKNGTYADLEMGSSDLFIGINGTRKWYFMQNGSLGLGIEPSQKLHVHNGRIAVSDGYNIGDTDANTGMFVSNDYFYVQTAGTTRFTVADNGKVGIACTPSYRLQVNGDVRINNGDSFLDDGQSIRWGGTKAKIVGSNGGDYLKFYTDATERVTIASNGKVTFAQNIDFASQAPYITFYGGGHTEHAIGSRNSSGNAADDLRINTFGGLFVNLDSNNNNTSGADFSIGRHGQSGAITDWLLEVSGETGQLKLNKYGGSGLTGTVAKYLAVDSSGNVIQTSSSFNGGTIGSDLLISTSSDPALSLVSAESGTDDWKVYVAGTGLKFRNTTDSNTAFELTEDNNGVLSGQLEVNNTTYIDVPTNTGTSSALIWRRLDHTIVGRIVADASNLKTQIWDNNSAVMTIGSDSVGIGSTTPNKTLSVVFARSGTNVTEDGLSGGGAGQGFLIYNTTEADNVYANLDFRARNADGRIAYQYKTATNVGDFHFITDNTGSPKTVLKLLNAGDVEIPSGDLTVSKSSGATKLRLFSGNNDPYISFGDNTTNWCVGIDRTDSGAFKIGETSGQPGGNNVLTLYNGNAIFSGNITATGSGQQMAQFGNTSARCGIEVKSSQWCEIFFTNSTYANSARMGMAYNTTPAYGTSNGDWYVYQPNVNNMDLVVKRAGGVALCGTSGNTTTIGGPLTVSGSSGAANTPVAWLHNSGNTSEYDGTVISTVNDGSDVEVLHVRTNNTTYSNGTSLMLVRGDGKIQIGNNLPMWSGSYGGALLLKGNNASSDRYAQLTTVDSNGATTHTGLIVKNGDVGINTTLPDSRIHTISSGSTYSAHFQTSSTTPYGVRINASSSGTSSGYPLLKVEQNGSHYFSVSSGGNTNLSGDLIIDNSHLNLDHGYSLQWADSHERIEATNSTLKFFTNNSQQMTLSGSFLGIGTAATISSSNELLGLYSAGAGHACFRNSSDSTGTVYVRNVSQTANTWQPYLILADSGGNRGGLALKYSTAGLKLHGQGGIEFWTGSSFGGGSKKFEIDSNGAANFTQSSTYGIKLTYSNGNTSGIVDSIGGNLEFRVQNSQKLILNSSGGTITGTLQVTPAASEQGITIGDASKGEVPLIFKGSGGSTSIGQNGAGFFISENNAGNLDSSPRFVIDTNGNCGIGGVTAPDSKIQIANANGSSYRFGYSGTSDIYFDTDTLYCRSANGGVNTMTLRNGNLGIADTLPNSKLDVSGEIKTHSTTDKISNGAMASTSSWTMYNGGNVAITTSSAPWKILNGVASFDDSSNGTLAQDSVFVANDSGKTFKLSFTIQVGSGGLANIWIGNKLGSGSAYTSSNGYVSYGNGTHTIEIVPTDTTLGFWANTAGGNFNIDNISCHEQHSRIGDTATFNGKVSIIGKTGYLLDVQQTTVNWTGRFENNGGAYGLSIDTANNIVNDVPNLACYTPTGTGVFVSNRGRLGIGLSAATKKLTIYDTTPVKMALQNNSSGTGASDGLEFYLSGLNAGIHNYENGAINFATNNTNRLTITNAGALQLENSGGDSYIKHISGRGLTIGEVNGDPDNNALRLAGYSTTSNYGSYGGLLFHANTGHTSSARRFLVTNAYGTNKFAIIRSSSATTDPDLSGTADFMIYNDGNIKIQNALGIGAFPSYPFHVQKSLTGNWVSKIYNTATSGNSGGLLVRMDEPGSSGMALGVNVNGTYKFGVKANGEVFVGASEAFYLDGGSNTYIYENSADSIGFVTGGTARAFVNNTGLGIATNAPDSKIHAVTSGTTYAGHFQTSSTTPYGVRISVNSSGTSAGYPLLYIDENGSQKFRVDSGGNVVISDKLYFGADTYQHNSTNTSLITVTDHGWLQTGPQNSSFCHFMTDRPSFYFNKQTYFERNIGPYADAVRDSGAYNLRWLNTFSAFFRSGDGSAGNPGITFINDLNTGIFRSANDTMEFTSGGNSRMSVSNSGIRFHDAYTFPTSAPSSAGQVLTAPSSGTTLEWADQSGGGSGSGTVSSSSVTSSTTNGNIAVYTDSTTVKQAPRLFYNGSDHSLTVNKTSPGNENLHVVGDAQITTRLGVGTSPNSSYTAFFSGNIYSNGDIGGYSKSFKIPHPTKEGMNLRHSSLEGPEIGVYQRGEVQGDTIDLPDYWAGLVRDGTVTVQLTPKGSYQKLFVISASNIEIKIGEADGNAIDCYYTIYGERADIDRYEVEYEGQI